MEMAIESEIRRQIRLYTLHRGEDPSKVVKQGTYRFDLEKKETILMRSKEDAEDYRYFPEPDLVPIVLSDDYIASVRASLPELPHQRFKRYVETLSLPAASASALINDKKLCDYFEEGLKHCSNAKSLCNWITVEFVGRIKESGKTIKELGIDSMHVAKLVNMIDAGTITGKIAKSVADDMVATPGKDCELIVKENPDYLPVSDVAAIETLVDQVLSENTQSVSDFKAGKTKAFAFLIGQAMKLSKGKASPALVNEILTKKLQ